MNFRTTHKLLITGAALLAAITAATGSTATASTRSDSARLAIGVVRASERERLDESLRHDEAGWGDRWLNLLPGGSTLAQLTALVSVRQKHARRKRSSR